MTTLGIQYAGWDSTWRFTFFGLILFWCGDAQHVGA